MLVAKHLMEIASVCDLLAGQGDNPPSFPRSVCGPDVVAESRRDGRGRGFDRVLADLVDRAFDSGRGFAGL